VIRAILFDWTNVIATDGYWIWLRDNVVNFDEHRDLLEDLAQQVDKAAISRDEFEHRISWNTGVNQDTIWPGVVANIAIDNDLIDLIEGLKVNYKVALLANFVFEWLDEILRFHDLYRVFDEVVISSLYKARKPEPEIYQKALDLLNVNPTEALLIDDKQSYVDGAQLCGMSALLYTTMPNLRQDLYKEGVELGIRK
jgi:FMN phosphatase YigB (HAD superfamily)